MTDKQKLIEILMDTLPAGTPWEGHVRDLVDHLIANGVTVQQWTPVTERLPTRDDANETESILAIHKNDGFVGRWIWDIVVRFPTEFTHWMPLPEPPKEGKDNA